MFCKIIEWVWTCITDRGFFHTVVGLFLGLGIPPIITWWRRPKLKCIIYDNGSPANASGLTFANIGVVNHGHTSAKAVTVRLFNLEPIPDDHPIKHLVEEYIPFRWAIDHCLTTDIAPKMPPRSCNILAKHRDNRFELTFYPKLDLEPGWKLLELGPGATLKFSLAIHCENGDPIMTTINISWSENDRHFVVKKI